MKQLKQASMDQDTKNHSQKKDQAQVQGKEPSQPGTANPIPATATATATASNKASLGQENTLLFKKIKNWWYLKQGEEIIKMRIREDEERGEKARQALEEGHVETLRMRGTGYKFEYDQQAHQLKLWIGMREGKVIQIPKYLKVHSAGKKIVVESKILEEVSRFKAQVKAIKAAEKDKYNRKGIY